MKLTNYLLFVVGIGVLFSDVHGQEDYCSTSLCSGTHIACNNNENYGEECTATAQVVPITNAFIQLILKEHNTLRNRIAGGLFAGFPAATRMATMQWDCNLAALARLSVLRCSASNDICRSTSTYPYAGQLFFRNRIAPCLKVPDVPDLIESQINGWFSKYENIPMASRRSVINSYVAASGNTGSYSTFAMLVQEKNIRVGCAILRQRKVGYLQHLMICNYAYRNVVGDKVYSTGTRSASLCNQASTQYKNLCSTSERYNLTTLAT